MRHGHRLSASGLLLPSPLWGGVGGGGREASGCVHVCARPPDPHPALPTRGRVLGCEGGNALSSRLACTRSFLYRRDDAGVAGAAAEVAAQNFADFGVGGVRIAGQDRKSVV